MKYIRILSGPYHGQTLQLEDDVADQAVADEWGADTAAKGYDRFNEPPTGLGDAGAYPASLQTFLDSVSGVQKEQTDASAAAKPKASVRAEPAGKLSDDVGVSPAVKAKPAEGSDTDAPAKVAATAKPAAAPAAAAAKPAAATGGSTAAAKK